MFLSEMACSSIRRIQKHIQISCRVKPSKLIRQREEIDAALKSLQQRGEEENRARPPLNHVHCEMSPEGPKIEWENMPEALDPHYVTFRGVKQPCGAPQSVSIAAMRANMNPRSARKRAQVISCVLFSPLCQHNSCQSASSVPPFQAKP